MTSLKRWIREAERIRARLVSTRYFIKLISDSLHAQSYLPKPPLFRSFALSLFRFIPVSLLAVRNWRTPFRKGELSDRVIAKSSGFNQDSFTNAAGLR